MTDKDQERLLFLAKKVKELRHLKGVSQEEALNDTGIHFGRIEQGNRDVAYTTLWKVIDYFDCHPKEFFKH